MQLQILNVSSAEVANFGFLLFVAIENSKDVLFGNIKSDVNILLCTTIPRGLTARIAGFHPAGPGSTPGVGNKFLFFHLNLIASYHPFILDRSFIA